MLNVGVHMLSLAGEHLLVQICFMFCFLHLLLFVFGVLSANQRGWKCHAMARPKSTTLDLFYIQAMRWTRRFTHL